MNINMENRPVNFCRLEEIEKGDYMLYNGTWRLVTKVAKGLIHSKNVVSIKHQSGNTDTVSAKSKQFVEVLKKPSDTLI